MQNYGAGYHGGYCASFAFVSCFPPSSLTSNSLIWPLLLPMLGASTIKSSLGFVALAQMSRPVASHFDKGVDFGLIIHRSHFMVQEKDPSVLSKYMLLEVNPGVARFLI